MGKLYVVGIGPGNEDGMTIRARKILDECRIIVGYKTYIKNISPGERYFYDIWFIWNTCRDSD